MVTHVLSKHTYSILCTSHSKPIHFTLYPYTPHSIPIHFTLYPYTPHSIPIHFTLYPYTPHSIPIHFTLYPYNPHSIPIFTQGIIRWSHSSVPQSSVPSYTHSKSAHEARYQPSMAGHHSVRLSSLGSATLAADLFLGLTFSRFPRLDLVS